MTCSCRPALGLIHCTGKVSMPNFISAIKHCGNHFQKAELSELDEPLSDVLAELKKEASYLEELLLDKCPQETCALVHDKGKQMRFGCLPSYWWIQEIFKVGSLDIYRS